MDKIEFHHTQTTTETELLSLLTNHIFDFRKTLVWFIFSALLCIGIIIGTSDANRLYSVPLAIFAGLMVIGSFSIMVFTLKCRPHLVNAIKANEGALITLTFYKEYFCVMKDGIKAKYKYSELLGQYWYGDYYIIHVRLSANSLNGKNSELFIIPLTIETFDSVYVLAEALTNLKKRLVRIKNRGNNKNEERLSGLI